MAKPLEGIRIVEVAAWTFVPAAGAILGDLGADVLKIEPPAGDPQRALQNLLNLDTSGPNPFVEIPNRSKRSVTLDLASPAGHDVLLELAGSADVFLTSYLPEARRQLRIDVDDVRAANPRIVYVRGSGWGRRGPMGEARGLDLASAWATSGLAYRLTPLGGEPPPQPAAFFDLQGGNTIAGAIAMALLERERTGQPSVVDVSLMNVGMWPLSPDIVAAPYVPDISRMERLQPGNPLVNWYRTRDGRWLYIVLLQADRFWAELCEVLDRPDLAADERYRDAQSRYAHREECVADLDAAFGSRTLAEWKERFADFTGVWAPVLSPPDLHEHAQVLANDYLPEVDDGNGGSFRLVASPMQFDEAPTVPSGPAPQVGQHTEEVLLELGYDWERITKLRDEGALG